MSVLETLSQGLGVICTPVGALPEVIEPEISGPVGPVRHHDALVEALVRIISDVGSRQKLARNARRRFQDNFEISSYADRPPRIYRGALGVFPTGPAAEPPSRGRTD